MNGLPHMTKMSRKLDSNTDTSVPGEKEAIQRRVNLVIVKCRPFLTMW